VKIQSGTLRAALAGLCLLASGFVWGQECTPSEWGADDELGAANRMSHDSVLTALSLATEGNVHPLGIVIDPDMPAFAPRSMTLQVVQPEQQFGRSLEQDYGWPISYNDDVSHIWWGIGPQLDGLGHLGENGEFYNCTDGASFASITGLTRFGLHNVPPLVGRGVMIDMARHFGVDFMQGGQPFGADDIQAAMAEQSVEIREGDIVLFHTGWTDAMLESDPAAWVETEPGITNAGAAWLASLKPMAVGADTWGVEAVPAVEGDRVFHGHVSFLKENGIYILETMNTGRLAQEEVSEFLFVLGQPRLKGAVQMIINPVAIW
jgi:kynurenine formamidase